ncbi:DUF4177 domain-containing protein [Fusibacter bizertensis]
MREFEYKVMEFDPKSSIMGGKVEVSMIEKKINEIGAEGWELVSTFTTNQGNGYTRKIVYTFKRER